MSKIPYYFETPVPKYFREMGWFDNPNTILFVTWTFSKCSTVEHKIIYDGKEITVAPYEFITGRGKGASDCFLSEEAFRHQLNTMQKVGLLKKTPNSTPNRFTAYMWVTERFSNINPQLNTNSTPNKPPTEPPQSRIEKKRLKKVIPLSLRSEDDVIDDFSSKIEIYQGIFLTQAELDLCIKIKGNLENVKYAVQFIETSKKRKYPITDWPAALTKWKIENRAVSCAEANIKYSEKLLKAYPEFESGNGWRCYNYHDKLKDQTGIIFESWNAYQDALFFSYSDPDFKEKCFKTLREKNMQKGRIN